MFPLKFASIPSYSRVVGLLLAACALSGCGTRQEPASELPMPAIDILAPVVSNRAAQLGVQMLKAEFPEARWIGLRNIGEELAACLDSRRVLIVPVVEFLPLDWAAPLQAFLDRGGAAVFIGCDPFKARVRLVEGKAQDQAELRDLLRQAARDVPEFSSMRNWHHATGSGTPPGEVRAAESNALPWPGVLVEAKDFEKWDVMLRDEIRKGTIRPDENSLVFHARGSAGVSRLAIECTEQDGSCWMASVAVTEQWQPFVVHEAAFRYFYGGQERGVAGDRFALSRARKIAIGLSQACAGQAPGNHLFGLSDIRPAMDPRSGDESVSWPDIFLLSPPYRYYSITADEVESATGERRWPIGHARIQGPLPRSLGTGGEAGAPVRWIPMFRAADGEGRARCWPASIHIEPLTNGITRKWAWIGVDVSTPSSEAVAEMTLACARRLQEGIFLYKAGCSQFSFEPESEVNVTARWTVPEGRADGLRVCAELYKDGYAPRLRRVVGPPPSDDGIVRIDLGRSPAVEERAVDYTLRVLIEDARVPGKILDRLDQPLKFLTLPRTAGEQEWVTVAGSRFKLGRRPVFMLGVNYWPLTTTGRTPGESTPHWLDCAVFDPNLVRRDLDLLAEAGVNSVSLQYLAPEQAPQLKFFLEEARKRGICVHLFVAGLQPLDQNLDLAKRLILAADLKNESQVFAIDVAWEPHLGTYSERCRFDADWAGWLNEQYGSKEHAERVLDCRLWKKNGVLTGPPDDELAGDGPDRAPVAAYRRFVHDFMSRRYGFVARWLRWLGLRQLLSARTGYGGTGQAWAEKMLALDPAVGAVHFNFISPEGWGLNGSSAEFVEASFITAYCRGVSDGKPVLWAEFGSSVGVDPQAADMENQARIYRNMFDMALNSRASGCFGWWFPSGWRTGEESDMGIVNPDGSWRPAGEAYRHFAHRLRGEWAAPSGWRGREMDVDAGRLSRVWKTWRDIYRTEAAEGRMEEIRPKNFGKRTSEITVQSVGGMPYSAPAPLESVNAEWGRVTIDGLERERMPGQPLAMHAGQKLRIALINTGPVTWDASSEGKSRCVWVRLENERGAQQLPVPSVRFGDSTWISWVAPEPGVWRIQPLLADVGPFGEPLQIEVLEPNAKESSSEAFLRHGFLL